MDKNYVRVYVHTQVCLCVVYTLPSVPHYFLFHQFLSPWLAVTQRILSFEVSWLLLCVCTRVCVCAHVSFSLVLVYSHYVLISIFPKDAKGSICGFLDLFSLLCSSALATELYHPVGFAFPISCSGPGPSHESSENHKHPRFSAFRNHYRGLPSDVSKCA